MWALLLAVEAAYLFAAELGRRRFLLTTRFDRRRATLFALGLAIVGVSEGTPVHTIGEDYLFSIHTAQHLALLLVAGPLLLAGTPGWLLTQATRVPYLRIPMGLFTYPIAAGAVSNAVLVLWHLPGAYQAVLGEYWPHLAQHGSFLLAGVLLWWPIFSPLAEFPRLSYPSQVAYLFLVKFPMLPLGAAITLSNSPIYDRYWESPRLWGTSALTDQQVGGVLMLMLAVFFMFGVLAVVFFRWAAEEARR
jgi:putative membrane protein